MRLKLSCIGWVNLLRCRRYPLQKACVQSGGGCPKGRGTEGAGLGIQLKSPSNLRGDAISAGDQCERLAPKGIAAGENGSN